MNRRSLGRSARLTIELGHCCNDRQGEIEFMTATFFLYEATIGYNSHFGSMSSTLHLLSEVYCRYSLGLNNTGETLVVGWQ